MAQVKELSISFDCKIFSKEAVLKACYQLADIAVFDISIHKDKIVVSSTMHVTSTTSTEELSSTLKTSVIDYQLRERIDAQTKHVKEILIHAALGNSLRTSTDES
ncbi:His-Xaa-Ser system protein HxsD [Shewanella dokdonensis]|uniref:His-Xaa-Ser system protein HxsD n=1 Tax=Shewanella dokdonensis TaxID=712036 RepID=A0ABX8DE49_9GAMM|nr:His-Xaa-Ser system protein HxsD [Shewanella dokdonensis]MCL1073105.1 His-Xaa-Ser system protein HxsD [Shewanella dokdonensis]QVK23012.1 His-Xaa-Ser system protein HxsD [Shewanella dokdonensis]